MGGMLSKGGKTIEIKCFNELNGSFEKNGNSTNSDTDQGSSEEKDGFG